MSRKHAQFRRRKRKVDALIIDDYAKAQASQTLEAWSAFLERYAAYSDNSLVKIVAANRAALQKSQDEKIRSAQRKPWLDVVQPDGRTVFLSKDDRVLVQKALSYMGFDVGAPDGEFGPKTLRAIMAARFKNGLLPGMDVDLALLRVLPDVKAIESLKSEKARYYDIKELPDQIDPRLRKAIESLGKVEIKFGYFEGRIYIVVNQHGSPSSWQQASSAARQAGGHLVTISSRAENEFVYKFFSTDPRFTYDDKDGAGFGPMIGLYQAPGSREPSGGWAWETGEPLDFIGWSSGNPDNFGGKQNYGRFFRKPGSNVSGEPIKYWDDTNSELWTLGYIMEIE